MERFQSLFAGLDRAYGTYVLDGETRENGKKEGHGITKQKPVTAELWRAHLAGEQSLGIVPIRDDASVVFGSVDIDAYLSFDPLTVVKKLAELEIPAVTLRSKSGGAHIDLFASEPTPAHLMRTRLFEIASALGHSKAEIFPVQKELSSTSDCGSWINMPYFGGIEGGRYALGEAGQALTAEEFLDLAEANRRPLAWFERPIVVVSQALFSDGPPCLERLVQIGGFAEGQRNKLMLDVALYCMKAFSPEEWKERAYDINQSTIVPPLSRGELAQILQSVGRKKYNYRCKIEPMLGNCDSKLCSVRAFGVRRKGNSEEAAEEHTESMPRLGQLRKLLVKPPIWFWTLQDGRTLELANNEILSPRLFQERCLGELNIVVGIPSLDTWTRFLREAVASVIEIEAPDDASDEGQLWGFLEKFATGRVQAKSKKELLQSKPWRDEADTVWFQAADFQRYLAQMQFKSDACKINRLSAFFHARGLSHEFLNIDGKGINVWGVQGLYPLQPADKAF